MAERDGAVVEELRVVLVGGDTPRDGCAQHQQQGERHQHRRRECVAQQLAAGLTAGDDAAERQCAYGSQTHEPDEVGVGDRRRKRQVDGRDWPAQYEGDGHRQHGADEGRERDEEVPAPRRCAPPCGHHQRDAAGEHGQKSEVHRRRLHGQRRADAVGGADAKPGPHAGGVRQRHVGAAIHQATELQPGNHRRDEGPEDGNLARAQSTHE